MSPGFPCKDRDDNKFLTNRPEASSKSDTNGRESCRDGNRKPKLGIFFIKTNDFREN